MQQFPEEETPFVYVTLATHVTLATAGYTPCLFGYVTIGLVRHNRTHFSQSERLLVKPQRPCTDLCAEPAGVWNRLSQCVIAYRLVMKTIGSGEFQDGDFLKKVNSCCCISVKHYLIIMIQISHSYFYNRYQIDDLAQDCGNPSSSAMKLLQLASFDTLVLWNKVNIFIEKQIYL